MKLSSAVGLAAQQMGMPDCQLRTLARTLAEQRAAEAGDGPRAQPATRGVGLDPAEPDEHGQSDDVSLRASHSLLTRTINMLK
jgi:hypothetical protein